MVKKTIAAIFSVLVLSTVLTACNTTRGVGEDISDGGNAISGAASAISALIAVKHGNYSSLTPPLSPVRTRKSLIWP